MQLSRHSPTTPKRSIRSDNRHYKPIVFPISISYGSFFLSMTTIFDPLTISENFCSMKKLQITLNRECGRLLRLKLLLLRISVSFLPLTSFWSRCTNWDIERRALELHWKERSRRGRETGSASEKPRLSRRHRRHCWTQSWAKGENKPGVRWRNL